MAKPGQSSFRSILLSRILLLSVPILLMGVIVTYRKAHSSIQETARQNLTESAVRKGERISESITALSTNLVTASETAVLQYGSPEATQNFLDQLAKQLPTQIQCVQLIELQTGKIPASTCKNRVISAIPANIWPQKPAQLLLDRSVVHITALLPATSELPSQEPQNEIEENNSKKQLRLALSAPVYDKDGKLRYALSVQSAVLQQEPPKRGSLAGSTVVIDQDGTILAHPIASRVGRKIESEADGDRLKSVMRNAIGGKQNFLHLFSLERNGVEFLAGYTAIDSPISSQQNHKWIILAVTRRDNALSDLREIRTVLVILTFGLIAASILATLYISRVLARPLEKLTDYALQTGHLHSVERVPHNFQIREFNQLSEALDSMVERLKAWAEELETAWKEAQAANKSKNEFLATTSHELRTPLNAIIGCIRLVRDDCCDDREEELDFLQRADDAAIHLLGIINDVLDIAKIEAGKLTVVMEPLDLRKLLKDAIDLQSVPTQQKGLQLYAPDLSQPIAVRADPAKLRQVLINVLGNATKFTEKGSITISVRVETKPPESLNGSGTHLEKGRSHARAIVMVKDTGIGIDPAQQHKLFRPFVMIDGTTTRRFGGTGLGLALSRNLMELMDGTITLSSDGEGKGTTVEISLPMIEPSLLVRMESTQLNGTAEVSDGKMKN